MSTTKPSNKGRTLSGAARAAHLTRMAKDVAAGRLTIPEAVVHSHGLGWGEIETKIEANQAIPADTMPR